ncbi:MAG: hypothetical protein SFX74_04255 [Fimbriimonadaceae bacterium]|nr:hypothetical protein [Fimbriimonadaceae bacterium]
MKHTAALLAFAAAVATASAQNFDPALPQYPRDYVVGKRTSYLMEPPTVLSPMPALSFTWSGDSRTLLYTQVASPIGKRLLDIVSGITPAKPGDFRPEIVIHEVASGRTRRIPLSLDGQVAPDARFVGQTSTVLYTLTRYQSGGFSCESASLLTVDGRTVNLDPTLITGQTEILPSPTLAEIYVVNRVGEANGTTMTVRSVDLNGRVRPVGTITGPSLTPSADGKSLNAVIRTPGSSQVTRRSLDVATGKVTESVTSSADALKDEVGASDKAGPILVMEMVKTVPGGTSTIRLVASDGAEDQESGLLTQSGRERYVAVSPNARFVAYATEGVTLLRALQPIDTALVEQLAERAAQNHAMSDAKQVATAFMMYAGDYNDTLPSNAAGWQDNVNPYLRNREAAGKFVYMFSGGSLSDVKNPSQTILGFIATKTGRAVAYADSSVKWVPNPK